MLQICGQAWLMGMFAPNTTFFLHPLHFCVLFTVGFKSWCLCAGLFFFKGTGAGKLATPPQPPARSPTTELTSKSGVSAWATAHDPYTPLKNGNMHIIGNIIKLNLLALVNHFSTKACVCLRPQKLTQDLILAITGYYNRHIFVQPYTMIEN